MSLSQSRQQLPSLSIDIQDYRNMKPNVAKSRASQLLLALLGFTKLQSDYADFLRKQSKALGATRACWIEFIRNSVTFMTVWTDPVLNMFEALNDPKDSLPNNLRDLNTTESNGTGEIGGTWKSLFIHFRNNIVELKFQLAMLRLYLGEHNFDMTIISDGKISARPFSEIVLDAIICFRNRYTEYHGRGEVLLAVPRASTRSFRPKRKSSDQKRQGSLACVSAMFWGDKHFTGATKIYWGGTLGHHMTSEGVHVEYFFMQLRRARFNELDGRRIRQLIEPQTQYFDVKEWEFSHPPQSLRRAAATEAALKDMHQTAQSRLPPTVKYFFDDNRQALGLAYKGDGTFEVKDKCCMCDAVYRVQVARKVEDEPIFTSAGETSKAEDECGVCAEALSYVQVLRLALPDWYSNSPFPRGI